MTTVTWWPRSDSSFQIGWNTTWWLYEGIWKTAKIFAHCTQDKHTANKTINFNIVVVFSNIQTRKRDVIALINRTTERLLSDAFRNFQTRQPTVPCTHHVVQIKDTNLSNVCNYLSIIVSLVMKRIICQCGATLQHFILSIFTQNDFSRTYKVNY